MTTTFPNNKKIVIFGAGRIGRSFIGQLFSRGGFAVTFIDITEPVIRELNHRGRYRVVIKSEPEEVLWISNVRGILATDSERVIAEVAGAGILAVCVGQSGLNGIIPLIAGGLKERFLLYPDKALDIIIAENMRDADHLFRKELTALLPDSYPLDQLVGLVETSIGKMVPIMPEKEVQADFLQVFAEPYNTLILDRKGFKNPIPQIDGLAPKDNMKAWVDRKLFIHNLGHATAAYLGYLERPDLNYMYEVLELPEIHGQTRNTMLQASEILMKRYPGEFTPRDLEDHIDDLLSRFRSRALGDTVFRVGCDLMRKLRRDDRLAGAIHAAIEEKLPYDLILKALIAGFHFRATGPDGKPFPGDTQFYQHLERGTGHILTTICGFDPHRHQGVFEQVDSLMNS